MRKLIALVALLPALAAADQGYYRLAGNVMAKAFLQGDTIAAELVTNMPASDIVGGPKSVAWRLYGSCSQRTYVGQGYLLFSGAWRGGYVVDNIEGDNVMRIVVPGSVVAKLFDMECPSK
jgi:hypothetical protein